MCDMAAYILRDGKEELVLENVDLVESQDGYLRLSNIFGEQKTVNGTIKSFSMRHGKIVVAEMP